MENIIEEKGSVSGEIIDKKKTDIDVETEEVLADMVDTLEKPEIRPKKERSQAQKDSFAKARLALQEKRRVARDKKKQQNLRNQGEDQRSKVIINRYR